MRNNTQTTTTGVRTTFDQVLIRPVTTSQADLQTLQTVATTSFTATFGPHNSTESITTYVRDHYNLATLKAEVAAPTSATFFLELNGQVAGYLKLNWGPTQTEANFPEAMEIQRIYLLPIYWGQHLGGYLMEHALRYARDHHFHQVWLGVWQHNDRAQAFYARYGFKPVATHQFMMGDHLQVDDLLLAEV